ncbi:MAG: hypothetical protein EOP48_26325 [Sphingobacteriales bacterium]|nr:MAG: hypothetical protein EOP48_26325 [Sphingobacteriales bacterium]
MIIWKQWFDSIFDEIESESNEAVQEMKEKSVFILDLIEKEDEFRERQENIPLHLDLALNLALDDLQRLSNNLNVAPEFLGDFNIFDGNILTEEQINSLPIGKYSASINKSDMCSICIKHFKKNEDLRVLPCGHIFHVECVDKWLKSLAACPNCKAIINMNRDPEQDQPGIYYSVSCKPLPKPEAPEYSSCYKRSPAAHKFAPHQISTA